MESEEKKERERERVREREVRGGLPSLGTCLHRRCRRPHQRRRRPAGRLNLERKKEGERTERGRGEGGGESDERVKREQGDRRRETK